MPQPKSSCQNCWKIRAELQPAKWKTQDDDLYCEPCRKELEIDLEDCTLVSPEPVLRSQSQTSAKPKPEPKGKKNKGDATATEVPVASTPGKERSMPRGVYDRSSAKPRKPRAAAVNGAVREKANTSVVNVAVSEQDLNNFLLSLPTQAKANLVGLYLHSLNG